MKKPLSLPEKLRAMYAIATDRHDAAGNEIPDPTPMEVPAGFREPPTIQQLLHDALRGQMIQMHQAARGEETLEDSMDYEIDEDPDALTPTAHEYRAMQEDLIIEGKRENDLSALRSEQQRVQDAAQPGRVRRDEERVDVPGKQSGDRASTVRSVEPTQGVREEGPKPS